MFKIEEKSIKKKLNINVFNLIKIKKCNLDSKSTRLKIIRTVKKSHSRQIGWWRW